MCNGNKRNAKEFKLKVLWLLNLSERLTFLAKYKFFNKKSEFYEQEIYDVFESLSSQAGGQSLQVIAQISRYNDEITLSLKAGETAVPLPKTEVKIFAKDE